MLVAATCIAATACGKSKANSADNLTKEEMQKRGYAMKFDKGGKTYIFTEKGHLTRLDIIYEDGLHRIYLVQKNEEGYYSLTYDGEQWVEKEWEAQQRNGNFRAQQMSDQSKLFLSRGYAQTGTATVCGKPCTVYAGTYDAGEGRAVSGYDELTYKGVQGEFAIWNGFCLRYAKGAEVLFECKAIKVDIADEALSQTIDVTWI